MQVVRTCLYLLLILSWAVPSTASAGEVWRPTGDLILRFEGDNRPNQARLDTLRRTQGVTHVAPMAGSWPLYLLSLTPAANPTAVGEALTRLSDVRWVEQDRWLDLVPHGAPLNDPYWDQLWHLENRGDLNNSMAGVDVNAVPAWEYSTGFGVLAAVIDGGVDPTQPDLLQEEGIDVIDDDNDATPSLSSNSPAHGTAVSGLIAAIGNNEIGVAGVAWEATILPVRMLGGESSLSNTYDAFALSTDRGADIINNSWGYRVDNCGNVSPSQTIDEALNYAHETGRNGLGTSITFSMGNESCHNQVQPILSHPATIGVGAINKAGALHGYSNTGSNTDIVAPSTGLRTTDIVGPEGMNGLTEDYTDSMGGTSGSCPLVSGVIALMYAANPRLRAEEVQEVLCLTADRVNHDDAQYNDFGWSDTYGCGRVDAAAAVSAVYNRAPTAPLLVGPPDGSVLSQDEVRAQWEAAEDLDEDPLTYTLVFRALTPSESDGDDDDSAAGGEFPPDVQFDSLRDTEWHLPSDKLSPGLWEVQVWAEDAWGVGAGSVAHSFEVTPYDPAPTETAFFDLVDAEAKACSCSTTDSPALAALFFLGLPVLRRRRLRCSADA